MYLLSRRAVGPLRHRGVYRRHESISVPQEGLDELLLVTLLGGAIQLKEKNVCQESRLHCIKILPSHIYQYYATSPTPGGPEDSGPDRVG